MTYLSLGSRLSLLGHSFDVALRASRFRQTGRAKRSSRLWTASSNVNRRDKFIFANARTSAAVQVRSVSKDGEAKLLFSGTSMSSDFIAMGFDGHVVHDCLSGSMY